MKINKILASAFISSVLFYGCNNASDQEAKATHQSENHEEQELTDIELNNGQKWQVNEEMVPYVSDSEQILDDYISTNSEDYIALASKLKEKNSGLINSCTMKGKSHDELHKWLHPHIKLIAALEQAEDVSEANKIISGLKKSFETYHMFFQ